MGHDEQGFDMELTSQFHQLAPCCQYPITQGEHRFPAGGGERRGFEQEPIHRIARFGIDRVPRAQLPGAQVDFTQTRFVNHIDLKRLRQLSGRVA